MKASVLMTLVRYSAGLFTLNPLSIKVVRVFPSPLEVVSLGNSLSTVVIRVSSSVLFLPVTEAFGSPIALLCFNRVIFRVVSL